jgi:putative tryptophan/tyrosine transport system substrate-binding protein
MRSDARRFRLPAIAAAIALVAAHPVAGAAPVVAVVKSGAPAPFERAAKAITAALRASAVQPEVLTFDLEGDEEKGEEVFARVRSAKPSLIITVGSLATASALAETTTEPIVFSMVLYPEQSGFTGADRRRVTGASLDIPPEVQFGWVRRLLPSARRLGVLYHPAETGKVVAAARAAATKHGFVLVAKAIEDRDDPVAAFRSLMEDVDVVWSVADGHVFTPQATSALILASLRRRVPLMGLSTAQVRAGALAALYSDYDDVGAQAAALALKVLGGEAPSSLPVTTPRHVGLALNLRTADHLGLDVPADVASEAEETVR